ncbi:hypothetical protein GHT20_006345 [Acinetobacter baumannii]|uniref:hypothetical protein n=1 Tax=Acinetobacter baumannii TaxID=470 RepID=UPI00146160AD|nr:hypothetical protein [Acinetobacter baumannii]MBJ9495461.1 hypothetical protein [Acinetobacter baumannii]MBJ9545041.1 hypothetical protein [Acinetobacter baumannii]NMR37333.1 hypothetical protein [Acinetobacter baumannii]
MDKPITFSEWLGTQGNMVLLHANCCRIAYEAGQQSMQAKVEELQRRNQMLNDNIKEQGQKLVYQNEVIETQAEKLLGLRDEKAELQKRVQFLEQELGAWKGKSIAAMINGMCKQCGKEPWQAIVSDKDGYALLHCFGCGANKYELVGEQALNGDQYDEHRKKAEEAISKGASLTNHRIEL